MDWPSQSHTLNHVNWKCCWGKGFKWSDHARKPINISNQRNFAQNSGQKLWYHRLVGKYAKRQQKIILIKGAIPASEVLFFPWHIIISVNIFGEWIIEKAIFLVFLFRSIAFICRHCISEDMFAYSHHFNGLYQLFHMTVYCNIFCIIIIFDMQTAIVW